MQLAQEPKPYGEKEVSFSDSMILHKDYVKPIPPGKQAGDPTVSYVCAFQCRLWAYLFPGNGGDNPLQAPVGRRLDLASLQVEHGGEILESTF